MENLELQSMTEHLTDMLAWHTKETESIRQAVDDLSLHDYGLLLNMFDSFPYAICLKDLQGNIIDCNKTFIKMNNNLPKGELLGKRWIKHSILPKNKLQKFIQDDLEVARTGKPKRIFETLAVNNQNVVTHKVPLFDDGKVVGIIVVIRPADQARIHGKFDKADR